MNETKQQHNEPEEVGLYGKILHRTEELLDSGRKSLDDALKKAAEELTAAGQFTREQTERTMNYVRRDLQHTSDHLKTARTSLKDAVAPQRVAAGAQSLFAKILSSAADQLSEWAEKAEHLIEFRTGEITSPGTLTCRNCGEELHMKRTAKIPPCPKCHQTLFRKSY
ncbi:MAG: hypothetical protein R6W66_02050 [Pelovirga sp.]